MANLQPIITGDAALIRLLDQISEKELLLDQGYLRVEELREITQRASSAYESAADHNSIQYRKYDKERRTITQFSPVRDNGYAEPQDGATLRRLKQQITELLHLHDVKVEPKEVFLQPGHLFTGRIAIRNILSRAQKTIDIKDDYLFDANKNTKNIDLLSILGPYLEPPLRISARLLGSSQNPPSAVTSDVSAFLKQYSSVEILGYSRTATGAKQSHDRFVIIDGKDVFTSGASIKDLGLAQSLIDQINDPKVAAQYVAQFDDRWMKGSRYPGL
ncbi:hypothetical protein EV643_1481 [Kribbella sp. VKM Ac-2527]|uniref:Uncharacterized protein n=1 Tax=Kribbella caucasensis TaxID=2512215 RepID=A0A4R6J2G9_9ACTN|nr:hypothetical protein [Kribbella sp. VKM Ac-2527]TDO29480.1 hypothetical protein EV643_1481 [Kribbella sp. VKM Ac-2527]